MKAILERLKWLLARAKTDLKAIVTVAPSATAIALALGIILAALGLWLGTPPLIFVAWVFITASSDVYGYKGLVERGGVEPIYTCFRMLLSFLPMLWLLGLFAGADYAKAGVVLWLFLALDLLYIFLAGEKKRTFTYFDLSPVVFVFKHIIGYKDANGNLGAPWPAALASGALGIALALHFLGAF